MLSFLNRFTSKRARNTDDFVRSTVTDSSDRDIGRVYRDLRRTFRSWNLKGNSTEQNIRELTEDDLLEMEPGELGEFMTRNNPTIAKVVDDFCTLSRLHFELVCDSEAGQQLVDEALATLDYKRNSFQTFLYRAFYSILHHGCLFIEIVFDKERNFSNLFCIDPRTAAFRTKKDAVDGEVPELGQYDKEGNFKPLPYDTIFFEAINPQIGEMQGHSLVASAYPSEIGKMFMDKDLRKVIKNHAWVKRQIRINRKYLKECGYTTQQIDAILEENKIKIQGEWSKLPPGEIPVSGAEVEIVQTEGASSAGGLNFVDMLKRVWDRDVIRGTKSTPFAFGSNEFVAESSAEIQEVSQSQWRGSHQDIVELTVSRAMSMIPRMQGITDPVMLMLRRTNAVERRSEAEAFKAMAQGVKEIVDSGIPLVTAIKLFEDISGHKFPTWLVDEVKEEMDAETDRTDTAQTDA